MIIETETKRLPRRSEMRRLLIIFAGLLIVPVQAETVKIPWKGDYAHNYEEIYSPNNLYLPGSSKNFQNGAPEEHGQIKKDGYLLAEIITPKNITGPVPFIILMHGCSGLTPLVEKWAKTKAKIFLDQGIGVLILDSFKTRQVDSLCDTGTNYHWGWRRSEDAYSALDYLIENKLAVSNQVSVMGRSNGGTAVVMTATLKMVRGHHNYFAAAFAVSPGCYALDREKYAIPLTIFIGDKDTVTVSELCKSLVRPTGAPVQMIEFKGVYHGYEDKAATYIFHGGHLEYNAKADKETVERTLALIKSKNYQRGLEYR
jgi:dienelactone hydrolase